MSDTELKRDTLFMLILIAVVGLAFGIFSSEPVQEFISDCSDTYTAEQCRTLWSMGND